MMIIENAEIFQMDKHEYPDPNRRKTGSSSYL